MQNNEIIIPILNPQIEQLPLYITQICVQFQQNNLVERADGFEDYQLAICLSGSGIFSCGGENYEINEHDAFLFSPGVPHSYQPTEQFPWVLDWVCYKGDLFDSLFSDGFCILRDIKPSKIGSEKEQYAQLLRSVKTAIFTTHRADCAQERILPRSPVNSKARAGDSIHGAELHKRYLT